MSEKNRRHFLRTCLSVGAAALASRSRSRRLYGAPADPAFEEIHKIDIHSHIFEDLPTLARRMQTSNLRIVNVCNRGNDPQLLQMQHRITRRLFRQYGGGVFPFGCTFDLTRRNELQYAREAIAWLEENFQAGAVLVKIWKEVGMQLKKPDGKFLLPDDPVFDPIYAYIAGRKKPLLAHIADPLAAWRPLDPDNPHYGYYSRNPEWHFYGKSEYPTHEELIASRDRILERHPDLVFIGAHMGSLSHDVDEVAKRLDRYPNFFVECSARTADLSRQSPEKVRRFFLRYSNRVLYGLDMTRRPEGGNSDEDREKFAAEMERRYRLDYLYYAGKDRLEYRGKTVEALALPREVLDLFYHGNAERLMPALRK